MAKKKLNEDLIKNELREGSAFFPKVEKGDSPTLVEKATDEQKKINESNGRTVQPNGASEQLHRSVTPKEGNISDENSNPSFMEEIVSSPQEEKSRPTQRYSFEIYKDQLDLIDEVKFLYKRKTGKKLSSSRILRDLIDKYLTAIAKELSE